MFKSSAQLRQEAAQRQLDRVASSWRATRTAWFDGTPEAIEARLAETNRILTVARSGFTPAHLGLAVEAANARKELLAARHRLLTDFLDDGARAFKGSRRVAESFQPNPNWEQDLDKTPGLRGLSEDLGRKLIGEPADYARSYQNEDGEPGLPGGWPKELSQYLSDPYSAGYAASGHGGYLGHEDPWGAAGSDFYNAGGKGGDSFDDGWIDYASDIPHRYNDPEGYAAHHAEMG